MVTQFRVHCGYLDSDSQHVLGTMHVPTPAMLKGSAFHATKDLGNPQLFLTTC
jgi:hypothetical protein